MKYLNKLITISLCFILFINNSIDAYAIEHIESTNGIQTYNVPVISNEYSNSTVTFYEYDGKYYLSLEDIKDFTRFKLTESDSELILTQGLREIYIEKDTGHMTDSDFVDQGNIGLLEYNGKYLCEAIPMLIYLGAACTIKDNKAIEILMPSITIWESIMPDYLDYYFNIVELYGSENNVKISLICDIMADLLDGISGHGLYANADTHLEDALYEILNVDMMKYESVQESASDQNQKINNFLASESINTFLEGSTSATDTVRELIDYYAGFYLNSEILKNEFIWQRSYRAGDLEAASDLATKINQQIYEQSLIKSNLNSADSIGDIMNIGMIALDTAITSYNLMQYDDDTRNLFNRTINEEIFKHTGYNNISWNNVSDKISKTLSNNESIIQSSALNSIVDFATEELTEKGIQTALTGLTSKANIYMAAVQLGTYIASLINYKSNQAFSADMNAIWLSTVQYDIAQLVSRMLIKESNEYHFSDAESLKKLKDMFTLYYRTTIAFSENIAVSIGEFGGKNRYMWVEHFKLVSDYVATYLYRITNCSIVPIADYVNLTDDLITAEWMENYKNNGADIFKQLPQSFVFSSGAGAWSTSFDINPEDGTFIGQYHDSNMGDTGKGYSNGTVYICNFTGKFSTPKQINDYTYSMNLEYLNTEGTLGNVYYEDGIRYIYSEPYGFEDADEFLIYLPGCPLNLVAKEFLSWSSVNTTIRETLPSGYYGIYNVGGLEGFEGRTDNNFWSKSYVYYYGNYRSELWPSYYSTSDLLFWFETGSSILYLNFIWSNDDQTEFVATDLRGTGNYNISLKFHDEYNSVSISIKSESGYDLTPWGGTSSGTLNVEYIRK